MTDAVADTGTAGPARRGDGPFPRSLPWLLLVGGLVGLAASVVLTVEKRALDLDPAYEPSCSINPVLSCGSVMATPQAAVLGPNSLIGVVGFAVLALTGGALLRGARPPRWYWAGLSCGALLGAAFVHWLIGQSLYRIGALCPYCTAVWAVTIPVAWYVVLHTLDGLGGRFLAAVRRCHGVLLTSWFVVLAALILLRFRDFWVSLVPA